jgi:hypothetical protein
LGDLRRTRRAVKVAEAMARSPGSTIPRLFEGAYDVTATYDLLHRREATPERLQQGHFGLVREALCEAGAYVLAEDTTTLSWSGSAEIAGLGPIGDGRQGLQGFHLHSVLAVRWPADSLSVGVEGRRPAVELLGLADQHSFVRRARPKGEGRNSKAKRLRRRRESQRWDETTQRLGSPPPGVRWVRVCDREGDIYEFLSGCRQAGHGFVVRANQDRRLAQEASDARPRYLFATARARASLGTFDLHLRSRRGQAERTARLCVSSTPVSLVSPWQPGRQRGSEQLSLWVVRVYEAAAPHGVKALEWFLLCDGPVESFNQARDCTLQYATRWLIEEFHKALKSGLGAERLQLETGARLRAAVAIMSVVALRLIDLRERVRLNPDAPAEQSPLRPLELKVLRVKLGRPIVTVREVALGVGRLGGHLNRKNDGPPGWATLARGMLRLQAMVEGVQLAQHLGRFDQ